MRFRGLFGMFIALLWVAAMHHCVLEDVGSLLFGNGNVHAEAGTDNDCGSHEKGDSSSHTEGKPCGTVLLQNADSQQIIPALSVTWFTVANFLSLSILTAPLTQELKLEEFDPLQLLSQLSYSLSLAPNAPPTIKL